MTVSRQSSVVTVVLCALLCSQQAHAQAYPAKPVRLIVPYAPGGANDLVSRLVGQKLAAGLGQPVVIENRAGAGGTIGLDACAKAPPDGYTVVMAPASSLTVAPALNPQLPYDAVKSFAPVSAVAGGPNVLAVHPSVPATTVREFLALTRARPGRLTYATSGPSSMSGLSGELLKSLAKIDMIAVGYKGTGPAVIELVGGHVDSMIVDLAIAMPHVRDKRLRALAVSGAKRSAFAPGLPTMSEAGVPGYDLVNWRGVLAPAGTPRDVVLKLNAEILKVLGMAEIREALAREGYEPIGDTPEQFAALIRSELARYAKLVKQAGIQGE